MMWLIYLIGILLAVICAKLLRLTVFQGETTPFVMELPPYRMPTPKSVLIHMWQRGWMFLRRAGTVILGISIVLWVLASFPKPDAQQLAGLDKEQAQQVALEHSVIGRVGRFVEPAIKPLGFDWRIGTALIGAVAAKEVFVSQLRHRLCGRFRDGADVLRERLRTHYTPLVGFCMYLLPVFSDRDALHGHGGHDATRDKLVAMGGLSVYRSDGPGVPNHPDGVPGGQVFGVTRRGCPDSHRSSSGSILPSRLTGMPVFWLGILEGFLGECTCDS